MPASLEYKNKARINLFDRKIQLRKTMRIDFKNGTQRVEIMKGWMALQNDLG